MEGAEGQPLQAATQRQAIENEVAFATHRGASKASRARGTRLASVSLEGKETNWSGAPLWGHGALEEREKPVGMES